MLDIAVPKVGLQRAGIVSCVRQRLPAGMCRSMWGWIPFPPGVPVQRGESRAIKRSRVVVRNLRVRNAAHMPLCQSASADFPRRLRAPTKVATPPIRLSRRSTNNKNNPHVAISSATSESRKRHEPVAQVRRGGDCLSLHHGNHRIDVRNVEPERLFAVDLPLC